MALAHSIKNTSKAYKCTNCASENVSIVREDDKNPRLKCNGCQFMFNGEDSLAALDAGAIKPSSVETLATATDPEVETLQVTTTRDELRPIGFHPAQQQIEIAPQRPSHLFLAKDRKSYEFCSKTGFKKTAIKWSDRKFDVYELKSLKLNVKVDVT